MKNFDKPIWLMSQKEKNRIKLEHVRRVLATIRSKYRNVIMPAREEVHMLRQYEKSFLFKVLLNNESGRDVSVDRRKFYKESGYNNQRLPDNFFDHPDGILDLKRYDLSNFDLKKVRLIDLWSGKGFKPDLDGGSILYKGDQFLTTNELGLPVDNCRDCENYNKSILDPYDTYHKRGVALTLGGSNRLCKT